MVAWPTSLHAHSTWALQTGPLRLEASVTIKDLHAIILAIGNIDPAVLVAADVVGKIELTGFKSGATPSAQMPPVGGI